MSGVVLENKKKEFQLKEICRFIAILAAHLVGKCSAEALIFKFFS